MQITATLAMLVLIGWDGGIALSPRPMPTSMCEALAKTAVTRTHVGVATTLSVAKRAECWGRNGERYVVYYRGKRVQ